MPKGSVLQQMEEENPRGNRLSLKTTIKWMLLLLIT